jgi:predicted deacylase
LSASTFSIAGIEIAPGKRATIALPVTKLYTHAPIEIPIHVIRGRQDGPRLFISAAIHGDEINGVEIIRRLLKHTSIKKLRGTLVAVPVVNVHGMINHSRYLPDRRDLNRSFPGSERGPLASRLAFLFMKEVVDKCTHGIDIHTGAIHRANLPQIRANLDDEETTRLARAFSVPVLLNSTMRDGSLREAAAEKGIPMLLYEAGEALRFDEVSIRAGVRGIINVMRELAMLPPSKRTKANPKEPMIARSSSWVRAPSSGIFRPVVALGARVDKEGLLGVIEDPFGEVEQPVHAKHAGIVIGRVNLPLINEGDALFHIARFGKVEKAEATVENFRELHEPENVEEPDSDSPII